MKKSKRLLALAITLACFSSMFAASFTPANIEVTRIGPSVCENVAKAYLDEYTTSGVLVQSNILI
jgi:hypothetical protein